jgi:hypothetical protein
VDIAEADHIEELGIARGMNKVGKILGFLSGLTPLVLPTIMHRKFMYFLAELTLFNWHLRDA